MTDKPCPCGSGRTYDDCCGRFLDDHARPQTAEELMRSRYSAFCLQKIGYLKETLWPRFQAGFDDHGTTLWASQNHWVGLTIFDTRQGGPADREGTVLFEAKYLAGGALKTHREHSRFKKKSGRWYYVEAMPEI